jgi:two-component system response regulator RpfG
LTAKSLRIVPSLVSSSPERETRPRGGARVVIVDDRSTARSLLEG